MPAISEYANLAGGQRATLRPPGNLEEIARWAVWFVVAYLAFRLGLAMLRWLARR